MLPNGHIIDIKHYEEHMENRQLQDKYILRMPDGMRDAIKRAAAEEGRSMNSQIIQHLRAIYPPDEVPAHQTAEQTEG